MDGRNSVGTDEPNKDREVCHKYRKLKSLS